MIRGDQQFYDGLRDNWQTVVAALLCKVGRLDVTITLDDIEAMARDMAILVTDDNGSSIRIRVVTKAHAHAVADQFEEKVS